MEGDACEESIAGRKRRSVNGFLPHIAKHSGRTPNIELLEDDFRNVLDFEVIEHRLRVGEFFRQTARERHVRNERGNGLVGREVGWNGLVDQLR